MTSEVLIALLNPVVSGFIGVLLLAIWLHHRDRRYVLLFGAGFLMGALAFVIRDFGVRYGAVPAAIGRFAGGFLFLGTTLAVCAAVHVYYRLRVPVRLFGLILLLWAAAFCWSLLVEDSLARRTYIIHAALIAFVLVTLVRVWPCFRRTTIDFAVLFGLVAAAGNLALPLFFVEDEDTALFWTLTMVVSVLLEVMVAFIFLAVLAAELLRSMRQEARLDVLSQLPNRRGFEEEIRPLLATPGGAVALILMDIDNFKRINDEFGHAVGDEVIRACGALLNGVAAPDVPVGRVGGEEFALCVARGGPEAAATLAETLRVRLAELPVSARVPELRVTASFGVAPAGDGADLTTVLAHADAALYIAKRAGRNRVRAVSPPFPVAERGDGTRRRAFRDRPS